MKEPANAGFFVGGRARHEPARQPPTPAARRAQTNIAPGLYNGIVGNTLSVSVAAGARLVLLGVGGDFAVGWG